MSRDEFRLGLLHRAKNSLPELNVSQKFISHFTRMHP